MSLDTWPLSKDNVNYTLGPSIQHELLFYFYLEEYIYEGIFLWLQASKILEESKFGQALFFRAKPDPFVPLDICGFFGLKVSSLKELKELTVGVN